MEIGNVECGRDRGPSDQGKTVENPAPEIYDKSHSRPYRIARHQPSLEHAF